ncbi:MAG TPA: glycine/sarcosine/betaine reductase selenoprotein B family protein [Dehalococcoidia bacterium]|nr:glycine/sarcosine/betaine reductase selenoprotein B family protein [Dehalococcoidia bacterium]
MPRLEQLSEPQRQSALYFPCMEHDDAPWNPWNKGLSQSRLGLVTTAGLHLRDDKPFVAGDPSYRVIPSSSSPKDVIQSHASIGFDHTGFYRDMNLAFPLERLRELVERGTLGSVAPNYYSFMGAQRDPTRIIEETAPEVARRLKAEEVDAVLLVPI